MSEKVNGEQLEGFNWDEGNKEKNWKKHGVSMQEAEQVFFNKPQYIFYDEQHSQKEDRFVLFGVTDAGRRLTVIYTIRRKKIRVISARDQQKNERKIS